MTIISRRIFTPLVGKGDIALERARRLAAIIDRAGGAARVTRVVLGEGAGDFEIYARFASYSAGTTATQAIAADPDYKAFEEERARAPVATKVGPYVHRLLAGELTAQPIIVQRIYRLPRTHLQKVVALMPELRALFDARVGIAGVVPVFAPEMESFGVIYYLDSLDELGETLDAMGTSEAFETIALRAAQYGALVNSRVLMAV